MKSGIKIKTFRLISVSAMEELPNEIVYQILAVLNYYDIIRLLLTCKTLYQLRDVDIFQRLLKRKKAYYFPISLSRGVLKPGALGVRKGNNYKIPYKPDYIVTKVIYKRPASFSLSDIAYMEVKRYIELEKDKAIILSSSSREKVVLSYKRDGKDREDGKDGQGSEWVFTSNRNYLVL